jgi:hypothetical protein
VLAGGEVVGLMPFARTERGGGAEFDGALRFMRGGFGRRPRMRCDGVSPPSGYGACRVLGVAQFAYRPGAAEVKFTSEVGGKVVDRRRRGRAKG